jgi:hypothetical protein
MNSASLCSLEGRYDSPIPTWFLAPIDCLKILAQVSSSRASSQCEENPIYVFLFWELRGLSPNFHIHNVHIFPAAE